MLRHLQKSVEEEEQVWKARVSTTEEELQKVQGPLTLTRPSDESITPGVHLPRNPNITSLRKSAGSEFHNIQGESRWHHLGDRSHICWILVMPYLQAIAE